MKISSNDDRHKSCMFVDMRNAMIIVVAQTCTCKFQALEGGGWLNLWLAELGWVGLRRASVPVQCAVALIWREEKRF
jgi:hypothetical protein